MDSTSIPLQLPTRKPEAPKFYQYVRIKPGDLPESDALLSQAREVDRNLAYAVHSYLARLY